jgi:uncharacterized protein (TIGR01319 family)
MVIAIDQAEKKIISRAQVPSTVESDITIGLKQAFKKIDHDINAMNQNKRKTLACSSAAGGLRIVSIGFVPELTSEAASRAALGAGAKIVGCFSYKLNSDEINEIKVLLPDIILLAGGTDGGDDKVITHNARLLSQLDLKDTHIVVAGNKNAYDDIESIFNSCGKSVTFTKNVMPEIGELDIEPCNHVIREIFIKNIIDIKGIAKAKAIVTDVIMPTPAAVLATARLLADGNQGKEGLDDLIVVDVGGATTDIHSVIPPKAM